MTEYMKRITEEAEWREHFYHECCEYVSLYEGGREKWQLRKCPYCGSEAIEKRNGREDPITFFFIEDYFCKQCNKVVAYDANGEACSNGPRNIG